MLLLGHVRMPIHDLDSPIQRERLSLLRDEGVALTGSLVVAADRDPPDLDDWLPSIDVLELRMAGGVTSDARTLRLIDRVRRDVAVALAPILMESTGTVHKRSRTGFRPHELHRLDEALGANRIAIDRAVCFIEPDETMWEGVRAYGDLALANVGGLDVNVPVGGQLSEDLASIAEGILAAATIPDVRVFIDPLQELDRTSTVMDGLLDRLSNPTPASHVVRLLNSVLFGGCEARPSYRPSERGPKAGGGARAIATDTAEHVLVSPDLAVQVATALASDHRGSRVVRLVDLEHGRSIKITDPSATAELLVEWQSHLAILSSVDRV